MQAISPAFERASKDNAQFPITKVFLFGQNLAFGKPITASGQQVGWEATKAVDAVIEANTGWSSQDVGSAAPLVREWIKIDLLWQTEIDRVELYWCDECYPLVIEILVSQDNENWTNWTALGYSSGEIVGYGEWLNLKKITCRYVKIEIAIFRQSVDLGWYAKYSEIHIMKQPVLITSTNPMVSESQILSISDITCNLDTIGLNEWRAGNVRIEVDNSDNKWSPTSQTGLFAKQQYQGTKVTIQAGFVLEDETHEVLPVFTGQLQEVIKHSDTVLSTLTCYDYWSRFGKVSIETLKDPATGIWYANQRIDFLVKQIFIKAGLTRFEFLIEPATTVIPIADFTGLSAQQGIVLLAEVMNFECGVDQKGIAFFRSRDVSGKVVSLEVRNKPNGDKNLISLSSIGTGGDTVINHFLSKNSANVMLSQEPSSGRPNSYDRYGHTQREIVNKFLQQLDDMAIYTVLYNYLNAYSEAKMIMDCETTFLPQVELGDIHKVTQQEIRGHIKHPFIWNAGTTWNRGYLWGNLTAFLCYKKSLKVVGLAFDLGNFTTKIKYQEV